jgi:hypothetical protein
LRPKGGLEWLEAGVDGTLVQDSILSVTLA